MLDIESNCAGELMLIVYMASFKLFAREFKLRADPAVVSKQLQLEQR